MKTVYLVRYGAYGDHIHMSGAIRAFKETGYRIVCEYNWKGIQIHRYNPLIDEHIYLEPMAKEHSNNDPMWLITRHKQIARQVKLFVNFQGSLEGALIADEGSPEYFWPKYLRNEKNTGICYYDQSMRWAGLTGKEYQGRTGEIYFKKEEHEHVKKRMKEYEGKFVIIWALRGTMWQKAVYPIAKDVCDEFLSRHPNTVIITTGDEFCKQFEWEHPQVVHKSARVPFRQMLLMTRYADLVVTPETGLGIGAGAYGTPKIMLLTAASLKNIVGNDKNDFSLQSDAWCSPCTRAIYNTDSCMINAENSLPICVAFDKDLVVSQMEKVYEQANDLHYLRHDDDPSESRPVYM